MWSKMADMEFDDEDSLDEAIPQVAEKPRYPWGLRICLTHKELEKLGLDADCDVGDVIDMRCFGEVTSVSKSDSGGGSECRIEIQIQKIAIEDETNEETPGGEDC